MDERNLVGTKWRCTHVEMAEFQMEGVVTWGIQTEHFQAENLISIQYKNGITRDMKLRRFLMHHEEIDTAKIEKIPVKGLRYYELIPEFEALMRSDTHRLTTEDKQRREDLWAEIKDRKNLKP